MFRCALVLIFSQLIFCGTASAAEHFFSATIGGGTTRTDSNVFGIQQEQGGGSARYELGRETDTHFTAIGVSVIGPFVDNHAKSRLSTVMYNLSVGYPWQRGAFKVRPEIGIGYWRTNNSVSSLFAADQGLEDQRTNGTGWHFGLSNAFQIIDAIDLSFDINLYEASYGIHETYTFGITLYPWNF